MLDQIGTCAGQPFREANAGAALLLQFAVGQNPGMLAGHVPKGQALQDAGREASTASRAL